MNDKPSVQESSDGWVVVDHRKVHPGARMGFWGGLMMGGSSVSCLAVPVLRRFEDMGWTLLVVATFALGAMLLVAGGKPEEKIVELAHLDADHAEIHVRAEASALMPAGGRAVGFDEVRSVVFGATRFPPDLAKPEIKVEAFTVCLELYDGSVLPVVEASPQRVESFQVARFLSHATGAPMLQAGLGA
jgi:hypothetical protein